MRSIVLRCVALQAAIVASLVTVEVCAQSPPTQRAAGGRSARAASAKPAVLPPGDVAAQKGDYHEALRLWREEWIDEPSAVVACNIGRLEYRVGTYVEAATWLKRCLSGFPGEPLEKIADVFTECSDELQAAREKVTTLLINAPEGAQIIIDKAIVLEAPVDREIFIKPGKHHIDAHYGERSEPMDLSTSAGQDEKIAFRFASKAALSEPAPKPEPAAPAPTNTLSYRPGLVPASSLFVRVPMEDGKLPWWLYSEHIPSEPKPGPFVVWPLVVGGILTTAALATSVAFAIKAENATDPAEEKTYNTAKYFGLLGFGVCLGATGVYFGYEQHRTSINIVAKGTSWRGKW